jgi:excisionase family DNA binding protein
MSASPSVEPRFLSVSEVALRFGVGVPTVRRWVREQRLAAVQVGGAAGVLRIPEAELDRLVAEARAAASS